jgi:hypothetical protein
MRLRITVLALFVAALFGCAMVTAEGFRPGPEAWVDAPLILAQQDRTDGGCVALDPAVARPLLREEMCALFCLEPTSIDAEVPFATIVLRRSPLVDRQAAAEELLFDVVIMDTAGSSEATLRIAERYGLDACALREAVGLARERMLMRMREEGLLDEANAACLLDLTRHEFRLVYEEPVSAP